MQMIMMNRRRKKVNAVHHIFIKFPIYEIALLAMYTDTHDLRYRVAGIAKPKRGRPKRLTPEQQREKELAAAEADSKRRAEKEALASKLPAEGDSVRLDGIRRTSRRSKLPERFTGVVQGKELDRVLVEEGVIDHSDFMFVDSDGVTAGAADDLTGDQMEITGDVIGHLQDKDGTNIGDLIKRDDHGKDGGFFVHIWLKHFLNL